MFSDCTNKVEDNNNNENDGRRELSRPAPFAAKIELKVANLKSMLSESARSKQDRWMQRIADNQEVSLETLQLHPNVNYNKNFVIGVITGIVTNSKNKAEATFQKGRGAGSRGNTGERNFTRMYRFSDFKSKPETNTVTILEGCGSGSELFSNDPVARDDGTICKYFISAFYELLL